MKKIFFDTNVLLSIYSYSLTTIKEIINALELLEKEGYTQIIPATVKLEFKEHYQKSRSRTGNEYPLAVFRKGFNKQKDLVLGRIEKIRPLKLSEIFDTDIDKKIEEYIYDTELHLDEIEDRLNNLEKKENYKEINDSNDCLYTYVEGHSLLPLSFEQKLDFASKAEIRFINNIKPGLSDRTKKEKYVFQKYGDVFIWYEILNNTIDGDEIIFIENEKKDDWWDKEKPNIIAQELEEEFKERFPNSKLVMMKFYDFYVSTLEKHIDSSDAKLEINRIKDKLNEYLSSIDIKYDLEQKILDNIDILKIEKFLKGNELEEGRISDLLEIDIKKIDIDKDTFQPIYDGDYGTICGKSKALMILRCTAHIEFSSDAVLSYFNLLVKLEVEIDYESDLIINNKLITAIFNNENHNFISYEIINVKSINYTDDEQNIGEYGNCAECSAPLNEDNFGDGTLCRNCMISKLDE